MFRETVASGLEMAGVGKGREDGDDGDGEDGDEGGSVSNVKIEGVVCSSIRLGNRLGELKGETAVESCWNLTECSGGRAGDNGVMKGLVGAVPQILLR
jgi:hypothetical protein